MCFDHAAEYADSRALSELPWFEMREGRLVLAADDLGPIVDVHTHLALSYVRHGSVDLKAASPEARHYLPLTAPLDLDVYANQNIPPEDQRRMKRDLTVGNLLPGGMRATHTAANLVREMSEMGITRSVLLPIDFPLLSHNAADFLAEARDWEQLVSLGSVHPYARHRREQLRRQKAQGARGIKVHPAVQSVYPDDPKAMELYGYCGEMDLFVLWHCGPVGIEPESGRRRSQLKHYWPAIHEHPETFFVLGHSGALQYEMAIQLARQYENVYLEISSQSLTGVRRILSQAPPERVLFGSDWPFYHQSLPLAKLLIATEGQPELRSKVLWDNAQRLFGPSLGH